MDAFLFWILPGMIGTALLFWLFHHIDGKSVKQVTLSQVLAVIFLVVLGTLLGWLTLIIFIGMAYDELDLGDIVVWKKAKKTKKKKASDAEILNDLLELTKDKPSLKQQLAEKLNFEFKETPIKGLEE